MNSTENSKLAQQNSKLNYDNNEMSQNFKSLKMKFDKKKESLAQTEQQLKTKEEEIEKLILINKETQRESKKLMKEKTSIQYAFLHHFSLNAVCKRFFS